MKHMLGVNCRGVRCFGRWIRRVIALYRLNTKFSAAWIILNDEKFSTNTKLNSSPTRLTSMDGKYKIDVNTSDILATSWSPLLFLSDYDLQIHPARNSVYTIAVLQWSMSVKETRGFQGSVRGKRWLLSVRHAMQFRINPLAVLLQQLR